MIKLKTYKLIGAQIFFLIFFFFISPLTQAEEASNWSNVPPEQIHQGSLTPLSGMRSLHYKMSCWQIGRHCSALVELSWELKKGQKKSQMIFEEMADALKSIQVKNKQVFLKAGYWADGNPLAKKDYLQWMYWRFRWKEKLNEFVQVR